jgi:SAM-dependent methyltransferase
VAAWLAGRGVASVGIDLWPGMIAVGRRDYPQVGFREGDFLGLPAADGEFGAAVAFYSIIHLRPAELGRAFGEIHRVLRPGALFLVAFHIGSEVRHVAEWLGHEVGVDFRFFEPSDISQAMERAGFRVEMRLERLSYPQEVQTRRAYQLARRPRTDAGTTEGSFGTAPTATATEWTADHIGGSCSSWGCCL